MDPYPRCKCSRETKFPDCVMPDPMTPRPRTIGHPSWFPVAHAITAPHTTSDTNPAVRACRVNAPAPIARRPKPRSRLNTVALASATKISSNFGKNHI